MITARLPGADTPIEVDLVMRPESDAMLRAIPMLKEQLHLNVELASPDLFIPVPSGWEQRSPVVARIGCVTIRHYDFAAQALAKIERGHARDLADVQAMLGQGLISADDVRAQFARMEPELFRFPAIDPPSFRRAVDAVFSPRRHDALRIRGQLNRKLPVPRTHVLGDELA